MVPHGQAGVPFALVCHYRMGRADFTHSYCGMVSLVRAAVLEGNDHTPSSVSSEDNLMMNCLPVCLSMFMIRSSTGSCGLGASNVRGQEVLTLDLQASSGSVSCIR